MLGGKHLVLLAAITVLVKCQKPEVSMSPPLKQVFTGDLFYLQCNGSGSHNSVKWYMNDEEQTWTKKSWKIPAAKPQNSGSYQCEVNGQRSEGLQVHVQELLPTASLSIKTGQPVAQRHSSVILQLEHEDGLRGWSCRVYRGDKVNIITLNLEGENDASLMFQPRSLLELETTFWCTDQSEESRSNQITVRTSVKKVSLEIYHLPVVVGQDVTLRCLVWGTKQISRTVFYRGDEVIAEGNSNTIEILNITDSKEGRYKCHATFTYKAGTGDPYRETSDAQDLLTVSARAADLSPDMSCSCPLCPSGMSYRYYRRNGQSWERLGPGQTPEESGTYRCQAVGRGSRTFLSRPVYLLAQSSTVLIPVVVVLLLIGIVICCVAFIVWYRRRSAMGSIYEDVALRSPYETMRGVRAKEDEYETLHPNQPAPGSKGGEYEALKAEGMKEGVYHTLSMEGASGAGGQGEASRERDAQEDLKAENVADGGYEALKKEGMKEGIYHSLSTEGASGEEGDVKR